MSDYVNLDSYFKLTVFTDYQKIYTYINEDDKFKW